MKIVNSIAACCSFRAPELIRDGCVDYICFHHHGTRPHKWQTISTATGLARFHATHPELMSHMPYSFVAQENGTVEQAVPLRYATPHAKRWNRRSIGIAVLGHFKNHTPGLSQWEACVELAAMLTNFYDQSEIVGHHRDGHELYLPGSSDDKNKVCPGELFEIARLRMDVEDCDPLPMVGSGVAI